MPDLKIGDKVPDFTLPTSDGGKFHLAEATEKGNVIVAFFPLAFTSVCTREMCQFTSDLERIKAGNAQVVGVSLDSPMSQKNWAEKVGIKTTLASDWERKVVPAFNVWGTAAGLPTAKRSVFVVGRGGKLLYKWVSDDPKVEPNYQEVEEAARKAH